MLRRTEMMPFSKPRTVTHATVTSEPTALHLRGAGLGEPPTPIQQGGSGPCRSAGRYRTQMNELRTGAEHRAGPSGQFFPGLPPSRPRHEGDPDQTDFPQSPLHPTVPGPPPCGGERRREPALPSRYPPPTPPGWAEPAPVNWIKGRGRGGGSRAEAAPPLPAEHPGPAPLALLEAGRDPRVPRLK